MTTQLQFREQHGDTPRVLDLDVAVEEAAMQRGDRVVVDAGPVRQGGEVRERVDHRSASGAELVTNTVHALFGRRTARVCPLCILEGQDG